ncbi:M48 family metallopeptidase [Gimesia panareensis]
MINHGHVKFGNTTIAYDYSRSPHRNTISVNVHPDGTVSVEAPKGMRKNRIAEAVYAKKIWILNQQEYFRRLLRSRTKHFVSGESFLYLGRQYKLLVLTGSEDNIPTVRLYRGNLEVRVPADLNQKTRIDYIQNSLFDWYRNKALDRLESLTHKYARNLGVDVESVRVREMQRRWGSANNSGRITFNWKIILAPKWLLEYVVAHEVCHLKYDDHSKEFWKLLERTMPDYERRRIKLAVNGPKYDLRKVNDSRSK